LRRGSRRQHAFRRTSFPFNGLARFAFPAERTSQPVARLGDHLKELGMDRSQKADAVAGLNAVFNEVGVVVVTRNLGLSVAQSTALRSKMRDAGASYKVAKNRLARLALKDTDYAGIEDLLTGPTALAYSADPVAAAKAAVDFAKTNDKLEIVGGSMGSQVLDAEGIKALASMPSLDELRGKLVGLINAPATKVVQLVNAPASKLARVFGAYAAKEAA
jgi:large subunit ribosomal protein L10